MAFEIYTPTNLSFQDYIEICQTSRTLADAYDRKDKARLLACLAPRLTVDYSLVVPAWGRKAYGAGEFVDEWLGAEHLGVKALATQHLLGVPYFKSVGEGEGEGEVVVEWQQLASHGRRVKGGDYASPMCGIDEVSDGRSWMQQTLVRIGERWRVAVIRPEVLYHTGDFLRIGRPDDVVGA